MTSFFPQIYHECCQEQAHVQLCTILCETLANFDGEYILFYPCKVIFRAIQSNILAIDLISYLHFYLGNPYLWTVAKLGSQECSQN